MAVESVHLNSFHPDSSLYVFPPTPSSSFAGNILSPSMLPLRTRGPSGFSVSRAKQDGSWNDSMMSANKLEPSLSSLKKEIKPPPLPRLRFGISSCIHPQCTFSDPRRGVSFLSTLASSPTSKDPKNWRMEDEKEAELALAFEKEEVEEREGEDDDEENECEKASLYSMPSSVRRLKSESLTEASIASSSSPSSSSPPPCLVFVSFHSPSPLGLHPTQAQTCRKQIQWKPYYLSFQPHSMTPILRFHPDPSLSEASLWVHLPLDVHCQVTLSMHMTTLELTGKFPFLAHKKLKFPYFPNSSTSTTTTSTTSTTPSTPSKKKRDTWTRTYLGLSLHFLEAHQAGIWRDHLQQQLVDTSFQVLGRVLMTPPSAQITLPQAKQESRPSKDHWESELALLHLELKRVQDLQNRT